MEFVVADLPNGASEQQGFLRIPEPLGAEIRRALFAEEPIPYGVHFILAGSTAGELTALCTSGPWAAPDQPGEFLLYVDGEQVSDGATREQALAHLLLGLA